MKKVSIVILTYNSGSYIKSTLSSCFSQTYKNLEILIVDDGSSDGTEEYLNGINGIKLIKNQENKGISKNLNAAVNNCSGEFIIFLGHDDILPSDHVEKMIAEFDENVGFVHCNAIKIDSVGAIIKLTRNQKNQIKKNNDCIYYLSSNNFIQSCGLMFRKTIFQSFGGWDERYKLFGEWLSYIKFAEISEVRYCKSSVAYYRTHKTNIIKKIANEQKIEFNQYKKDCRSLALQSSKRKQTITEKMLTKCAFIINRIIGEIKNLKNMVNK